jgi:hypothetical protein
MINLSIHGANAGDIFPHANVKNPRNRARDSKNRENNPMHSSEGLVRIELLIFRIAFDSSGKTAA